MKLQRTNASPGRHLKRRDPDNSRPTLGTHRATKVKRFDRRFWIIQSAGWLAYGTLLMVPWLGEYSVGLMLPNKIVIVCTGLLVTTGLRELYRTLERAGTHRLMWLLPACFVGGVVWERVVARLGGGPDIVGFGQIGSLTDGIPMFGGAAYHALVLLAWSAMYFLLVRYPAVKTAEPIRTSRPIVIRDGAHYVHLVPEEIDWIEAAGDYVRVHGTHRTSVVRTTMGFLECELAPHGFIRIHRSTLVNLARIREIKRQRNNQCLVRLSDGTNLRSSRGRWEQIRRAVQQVSD